MHDLEYLRDVEILVIAGVVPRRDVLDGLTLAFGHLHLAFLPRMEETPGAGHGLVNDPALIDQDIEGSITRAGEQVVGLLCGDPAGRLSARYVSVSFVQACR